MQPTKQPLVGSRRLGALVERTQAPEHGSGELLVEPLIEIDQRGPLLTEPGINCFPLTPLALRPSTDLSPQSPHARAVRHK